MDKVSRKVRSKNMSRIRSKGNRSTEKKLRSLLMRNSIRNWRMHRQDILGCPDFAFGTLKLVIFVDGCFWHGCPKCGHMPKSNESYWNKKLMRNKNRDELVNANLREKGWKVYRIWECELKQAPGMVFETIFKLFARNGKNAISI